MLNIPAQNTHDIIMFQSFPFPSYQTRPSHPTPNSPILHSLPYQKLEKQSIGIETKIGRDVWDLNK